jgi:hypothetical protein
MWCTNWKERQSGRSKEARRADETEKEIREKIEKEVKKKEDEGLRFERNHCPSISKGFLHNRLAELYHKENGVTNNLKFLEMCFSMTLLRRKLPFVLYFWHKNKFQHWARTSVILRESSWVFVVQSRLDASKYLYDGGMCRAHNKIDGRILHCLAWCCVKLLCKTAAFVLWPRAFGDFSRRCVPRLHKRVRNLFFHTLHSPGRWLSMLM